jgi:O-antigen/teichoic acid export membrane protein
VRGRLGRCSGSYFFSSNNFSSCNAESQEYNVLEAIKARLKLLSGDKKSVLALVGGTTLAQALSFLFSPIQTRLFSPEVFGELSVFTSITGIVGIIICLRYELAIVLPKDDDEGFALLKLSWLFAAIIAGISLIVFCFWGKQIYTRFNAPALARYWYYAPITLLLTGIIQAANYWLTRRRQFTVLSYNKVLPVLAVNLVSIGLGFAGNRALGARLFSILVGNIVNIAVLVSVLVPDMKTKREQQFLIADIISKYKNFLIYDVWSSLINNLSWMMVPILLNYYYGSFFAGQYSIGLRVIQIPMSIIGASIGQVFLKTASEKKYTKDLYFYTVKIIKQLFFYTMPFAIILLLFGKQITMLAFGNEWGVAGEYIQILSPWAIIWFVASTISVIFPILGKQNITLLISIFNLATRFLSIYIGSLYNSALLGIILFSISGVIVYSLILFGALILARRL